MGKKHVDGVYAPMTSEWCPACSCDRLGISHSIVKVVEARVALALSRHASSMPLLIPVTLLSRNGIPIVVLGRCNADVQSGFTLADIRYLP
jgi:hypothetical protein